MNKKELAKEIADRMSIPVSQTLCFLDTLADVVSESVSRKESVLLQNFGHFTPWEQAEREGRNPKTNVSCIIRKRLSVKFKPGKGFIERMNQEKTTADK